MAVHAPWDFRIALDLFLGGIGIGLFGFSVFLRSSSKERYSRLIVSTAYLAPTFVMLGMLLLMTELGRPLQTYVMIYSFNTSSLTAWGTVVQSAFIGLGFFYALLLHRESGLDLPPGYIGKLLAKAFTLISSLKPRLLLPLVQLAGCLFALIIGIYHGSLLVSMGRPLWLGIILPLVFLSSSLLGSAAALVLVNRLLLIRRTPGAGNLSFTPVLAVLALLQLALVAGWQLNLPGSGREAVQAISWMLNQYGMLWYGGFLGVGLLLPLVLTGILIIRGTGKALPMQWELTLCSLFIIGGFLLKYIVVLAGQAEFSILD